MLAQCSDLAHLNFRGNRIGSAGQRVLEECWPSAERLLTRSGKGGFELRGVVKRLVFFIGTLHCLLVAISLAGRQQEAATNCTQSKNADEIAIKDHQTLLHIQTLLASKS